MRNFFLFETIKSSYIYELTASGGQCVQIMKSEVER